MRLSTNPVPKCDPQAAPVAPAPGLTVLVVDDSTLQLRLYAKLVKNAGYGDVTAFSTSTEALAWANSHEVDLAIVDYATPAPDGLKFIKLLREMPDKEHTPILMVTADQAKHVRNHALELGVNDFLAKPVDATEFTARLKNLMALRQSQKHLAETANWLADQVKAATSELVAREREAILTLSMAAERRDPETAAHLARIAHFCEALARASGQPKSQQELILATAPLHDIGKIGIPDSILLNTGKLTPTEFEIMKQHTFIGYEILKPGRSSTMQMAAQIALTHHERFDGSGYPHALAGQKIPVVGRICAISDVFDALTSQRTYKSSRPVNEAVAEITAGAGSLFDPALVAAFNNVLPEIIAIKERYPEERA